MEYIKLNNDFSSAIKKTAEVINAGDIAILPTDTVYGISADCLNEKAVERIYNIKQRDFSKPCNILASNIEMIKTVTKGISKKEQEIMEKFFPRCINNHI